MSVVESHVYRIIRQINEDNNAALTRILNEYNLTKGDIGIITNDNNTLEIFSYEGNNSWNPMNSYISRINSLSPALQLIRGQDEYIKNLPTQDGRLAFAVDSKKIYLDCDFKDPHGIEHKGLLSFGGNTGIYFGIKTFTTDEIENNLFNFIFPDDFDSNNEENPEKDDIIINTDGCFYRVIDIEENENIIIATNKLTVAGSGGGGGGSYGGGLTVVKDPNQNYNIIATTKSIPIGFKVIDSIENTTIDVEVTINGIFATTFRNVKQNEYTSINLYNYLSYFSINDTNTVVLRFINEYDHAIRLTIRNIRIVSLSVELSSLKSSTSADNINLSIKPYGGSIMLANRWFNVRTHVPTILNTEVYTESYPLTIDNGESLPFTYNFLDRIEGKYTFDVWISGQVEPDGEILSSPEQSISVYWRDPNSTTPSLVTDINQKIFDQYDKAIFSYYVVHTDGESNINIKTYCDDVLIKEDNVKVINNSSASSYFFELSKFGIYKFVFSILEYNIVEIIDDIIVNKTESTIPEVTINSNLQLYLDANGRNNDEVNPAIWNNKGAKGAIDIQFLNFNWKTNGWITSEDGSTSLHLTNGAKIEIPYAPFSVLNDSAENTGKTIEIIFKISNIRNIYGHFLEMASKNNNDDIQCGIIATGESISLSTPQITAYKTLEQLSNLSEKELEEYYARNGTRAYLAENKRIHIAFSIGKNNDEDNRMIYTYVNGVVSGLMQYPNGDIIQDISRAAASNIIINSDYADVDIYAIRVYDQFCGDTILLNNYAADLPQIEDRVNCAINNDALTVKDEKDVISLKKVQELGNIPYIVFTDLRPTGSKKGKNSDGTIGPQNKSERRLPNNKSDYRWAPCYFVDPEDAKHLDNRTETGYEEGYIPRSFGDPNNLVDAVIYAQGTSTLAYAVKNLRLRFVNKKDYYSLRPAIRFDGLDSNDNSVRQQALEQYNKFENIPKVALFTLKKDFMDSSMAHNTGIGNILTGIYSDINLRTAAQKKYDNTKTIVNNIVGFPCLAFKQLGEGIDSAEYIGRYNFNTDKDSKDDSILFGFTPNKEDKFGVLLDDNNNLKEGFIGTLDEEPIDGKGYYTQPIHDPNYLFTGDSTQWKNYINTQGPLYEYITGPCTIQCWEFLVNFTALNQFQTDYDENNDLPKETENEIVYLPKWCQAFESRYPAYPTEVMSDKRAFKRLINWVHSTDQNFASDRYFSIEQDGFTEQYGFTQDTKQYRLEKFKREFDNYMDKDFTIFYYIITELFLMIDSRAKNMMMACFDADPDNPDETKRGHWFPIFYDMDTSLGVNNSGILQYNYDIDDATEYGIYNASANYGHMVDGRWKANPNYSALWANFREAFNTEIKEKYNLWKKDSPKLNPAWILETLNKQQAEKFAEVYDNKDAQYSYVRPLTESVWIEDKDGKGERKSDKLSCEQGTRSLHRQTWLTKRFNLLDGKYAIASESNEDIELHINSSKFEGNNHPNPEENFVFHPISQSTQYLSVQLEKNGSLYPVKLSPEIENSTNDYAENANDAKFYIYNLGDVYDLGDFSNKFCGYINFKTQNKLRTLKLGQANWIDDNLNEQTYTSIKSLEISGLIQCPLLETLDIQNVQFNPPSNVSSALSQLIHLQILLAKGSNLKMCALPAGSNIKHLELPAISTLKLQDCISLDTIHNPLNLFIEDYSNLAELFISGCKNLNTQNLLEQIYTIQQNKRILNRIRLTDINWTIIPNENNCVISNNIINDIKIVDFINSVPNAYTNDGKNKNVEEETINCDHFSGKITINNDNYQIDDYNLKLKYGVRFPKLEFVYTNNNNNIIKGYSINLHNIDDVNLNIPANTVTNKENSIILSNNIAIGYNLADHLLNKSDIPTKTATAEWNYEFKGWSLNPINPLLDENEILAQLNYPMYYDEINQTYTIENAPTSLSQDDYQDNVLNLYAVFQAHKQKYTVTFMKYAEGTENNETYEMKLIEYGSVITLPEVLPVLTILNSENKSDTQICYLNTYQYNNRSFDQYQVSQTMTLYPIYLEPQPMNNITNPPTYYFDTQAPQAQSINTITNTFKDDNGQDIQIANGIEAIIKEEVDVEALCVPKMINDQYVVSIRNRSSKVKRIYFEQGSVIKYISGQAGFNGSIFRQKFAVGDNNYNYNYNDITQTYEYVGENEGQYVQVFEGFVKNGANTQLEYIDLGALNQLEVLGGGSHCDSIITSNDRVFCMCPNLYITTLPNTIRYITDYTFYNDSMINISAIPTDILFIGSYAFTNCKKLQDVYLKFYNYSNTILSNIVRDYNKNLIENDINSITNLSIQWPLIGDSAFQNCSNLNFYELDNENNHISINFQGLATIGPSAFSGCTALTWPNDRQSNINDSIQYIGANAFNGCNKLVLRNLPTDLRVLEGGAFANINNPALSSSLLLSTFPGSLRKVGSQVFQNTSIAGNYSSMLRWICPATLINGKSVLEVHQQALQGSGIVGLQFDFSTSVITEEFKNTYMEINPWAIAYNPDTKAFGAGINVDVSAYFKE